MAHKKTIWFRAKRYGWGWFPVTWEGWLILAAYIISIIIIAVHAANMTNAAAIASNHPGEHGSTALFLWSYLPPIVFISLIMIAVCYKTGEKPRWRWG